MKNIPEERLSTIGKLIEVTREEKRNKSQNKYTMKSFVEGICTVNTLKRIEAGEIARIEDVYVELLDKLNLKLGYFPAVDDAILELMNPLYEAIEYYRVEDISKYCDMGLRVLGKVKNYVYYSELYDLLMATKEYYDVGKIISVRKMHHYRKIFLIMNIKFSSLFKRLIFMRAKIESFMNPSIFKSIVNEIGFTHTDDIVEGIMCLNYYLILENFLTFKEKALHLEKLLIKSKNQIRLLDVYSVMLYVMIKLEHEFNEGLLIKAEELIKSSQVPKFKIMEFYANLAAILHETTLYNEALNFYNKMMVYMENDKVFLPSIICMIHCQRVLGKGIEVPILKEEQLEKFNILDQKIYKYFITNNMKQSMKINFILKEIAPSLNEEIIITIMRDELKLLIEQTGSYKSLYIFDEIIKENNMKLNDIFLK